jgi:hypothetical protein
VFFSGIDFQHNKTLANEIIAEAMTWTKQSRIGIIPIKQTLTYMWGCGPDCSSTSVLVDVNSALAKMKFGLMDFFESRGIKVERTAWGATAHIQVVWSDENTEQPLQRLLLGHGHE